MKKQLNLFIIALLILVVNISAQQCPPNSEFFDDTFGLCCTEGLGTCWKNETFNSGISAEKLGWTGWYVQCQTIDSNQIMDSQYTCKTCAQQCKKCQENIYKCTECSADREMIGQQCLCISGFFENQAGSCQACMPQCKSCKSGETCLECPEFSNRELPTCSCIQGYNEFEGTCIKCPGGCAICQNQNICIECYKDSGRILENGICQCKTGLYPIVDDYKCQVCPLLCKTCAAADQCTTCRNQLREGPQCECIQGYYSSGGSQCSQCKPQCFTCSSPENCDSCPIQGNRHGEKCVCDDGYFEDQNFQCQKCKSVCQTCEDDKFCLSCFENSNRQGFVCACIDGFFDNQGNCEKCQTQCQTCIKFDQCTTCAEGSNRSGDKCECDTGYYEQDGNCQKCIFPCQTCSGPQTCLSCEEFSNRETPKCDCIQGFYDLQGQCSECSSKCISCQFQRDDCLVCNINNNNRAQQAPICPCIEGYFENNQKECQQCHVSCKLCVGAGQNECLSCGSGLFLLKGSCISECGELLFENQQSNTCDSCHQDCATCNGANLDNCESCYNGFFLVNSNSCQICASDKCLECKDGPNQCVTCNNQNPLRQNNPPICSCLDGYYEDKNFVCTQCHNTCQTCSGPQESDCLICQEGLFMKVGICVSAQDCGDGFYPEESDNTCAQCDESCITCVGGSGPQNCLTCKIGVFDYELKKCAPCGSQCLSCADGDRNQCLECKLLSTFRNNDLPKCSCIAGFYESGEEVCGYCDQNCATCYGQTSSNCLSCKQNFFFHNNTCAKLCPDGYFGYEQQMQCVQCHPNCVTCNGPTRDNCTSCDEGTYRTGRSCLCQNGYYDIGFRTCSQCSKYCTACSQSPSNCVTPLPIGDCAILYEKCNFQGKSQIVCDSVPQHDFDAKSFYVPPKRKITLYDLEQFQGQTAYVKNTVACLENIEFQLLEKFGVHLDKRVDVNKNLQANPKFLNNNNNNGKKMRIRKNNNKNNQKGLVSFDNI